MRQLNSQEMASIAGGTTCYTPPPPTCPPVVVIRNPVRTWLAAAWKKLSEVEVIITVPVCPPKPPTGC